MALSVLGAAVGLLFAVVLQRGLPVALQYAGVRSPQLIHLQAPAFLFALITLILTALVFTLVPTVLAWKSDHTPARKPSLQARGPAPRNRICVSSE